MHGEHAELISALRSENQRLTVENSEIVTLRAIISGQDQLLKNAQKIINNQQALLERQLMMLAEMNAQIQAAEKCP